MDGAVAGGPGSKRLSRNARGLGGFHEAVMSLTVVTLGVMLLTASFALLSADDASGGAALSGEAREIMDTLLSEVFKDRVAERSDLLRLSPDLFSGDRALGVSVMLTEIGGGTEVLYRSGEDGKVKERASLGEPVNVRRSPGDVRPASLTVWVWR